MYPDFSPRLANNALHLTVADGRAAARPSLWRPQVNANTLAILRITGILVSGVARSTWRS